MLKNVKWEQSGINSNVKPPIGDGKGFVAPSATPYRQILELDLPEDFSGKDALVATQKGMDACYSGANELPGILSGIGRGMTLKDNASYAGLMKLFDATNQTIGRSSLAASIYQQRGFVPTENDINQILVYAAGGGEGLPPVGGTGELDPLLLATLSGGGNPTGAYISPYYDYDWTQAGAIPFLNEKPDWGAIGQGLVTGAKAIGWGLVSGSAGFLSGFAGFVGDTLGGIGAMGATKANRPDIAYSITKMFDFRSQVDDLAQAFGVNTNSDLYTMSRVAGQVVANVGVHLIPVVGKAGFVLDAALYGVQGYAQGYRNTIDNRLKQNGVSEDVYKSKYTWPDTMAATKYIKKEDYNNAFQNGVGHSAINFTTTIVTGGIMGSGATVGAKAFSSAILHTAGAGLHQVADVNAGNRDDYNPIAAAGAGALAAEGAYLSASGAVDNIWNKVANTSAGKKLGEVVNKTIGTKGVELVHNLVNKLVEDSYGGSHSFTVEEVYNHLDDDDN